ncbi:MAG: hypothetical protein JNM75_01580 [Rhodospirillales bacterium]|nr:hypothetical protein [Rhodospirillales bacterium]
MSNPLLEAALEEERQLVARLDAVRAVIRIYGKIVDNQAGSLPGADKPACNTNHRPRPTRSPSAHTQQIKDLIRDLLDGESEPTPTRLILSFLDGEGIEVRGTNKISALSAILSHAEEFETVGRQGWILKSRTPDAGTSGAASTDEVRASSNESQMGAFPSD